ncbi:hypothetical protein PSTG_19363 [Puccinia striiformis f. sp. tritici PST-78]|uniref:Uncharacterized protein n=1 Tax=Puccinia striiformis f. sp. tritici PST-78 TaxID=1165861 RepID=A0A0L0UJR5_9BASI|nr:hypothetical protein PSTG_19363 [Puccinia striiformis f. sp. tritici PST-78]
MCAGFPVTKRATRYTGPRAYRITAHPLVSAVHGLQKTTNTRNYVQLLDRGQGSQFLGTVSMKQPTMYSYMASHRYLYQNVFNTSLTLPHVYDSVASIHMTRSPG